MTAALNSAEKIFTIFYLSIYYVFFFLCLWAAQRHGNRKGSYTGGISILIPSYDEVLTIPAAIRSVLQAAGGFPIEILVIDDGKGSDTSDFLKAKYQLREVNLRAARKLKTKPIRRILKGELGAAPLLVIDKENGRKADALNAGLRFARYDYFLCLDADSVLDKRALKELCTAIEPETLAMGGSVKPILPKRMPPLQRLLTTAQIYEYARSFSVTRMVYEALHAVPLISGAISLFQTETVCSLGGYNPNTKGEDFELTLRLQAYAAENGGTIHYNPNAVVYTQVPFDIASVFRQRRRWHQGMLEVFKIHRKMFYKPSRIALALHHMRLYEEYGCFIEILFLLRIRSQFAPLLAVVFLLGMIYTLYAACKSSKKLFFHLFTLSIFGIFFHCLNDVIKLTCYFTKNTSDWGSPRRMRMEESNL